MFEIYTASGKRLLSLLSFLVISPNVNCTNFKMFCMSLWSKSLIVSWSCQ